MGHREYPIGTKFSHEMSAFFYIKTPTGYQLYLGEKYDMHLEESEIEDETWEGWTLEYPKEHLFDKLYERMK